MPKYYYKQCTADIYHQVHTVHNGSSFSEFYTVLDNMAHSSSHYPNDPLLPIINSVFDIIISEAIQYYTIYRPISINYHCPCANREYIYLIHTSMTIEFTANNIVLTGNNILGDSTIDYSNYTSLRDLLT
jgi:hypothetical protein